LVLLNLQDAGVQRAQSLGVAVLLQRMLDSSTRLCEHVTCDEALDRGDGLVDASQPLLLELELLLPQSGLFEALPDHGAFWADFAGLLEQCDGRSGIATAEKILGVGDLGSHGGCKELVLPLDDLLAKARQRLLRAEIGDSKSHPAQGVVDGVLVEQCLDARDLLCDLLGLVLRPAGLGKAGSHESARRIERVCLLQYGHGAVESSANDVAFGLLEQAVPGFLAQPLEDAVAQPTELLGMVQVLERQVDRFQSVLEPAPVDQGLNGDTCIGDSGGLAPLLLLARPRISCRLKTGVGRGGGGVRFDRLLENLDGSLESARRQLSLGLVHELLCRELSPPELDTFAQLQKVGRFSELQNCPFDLLLGLVQSRALEQRLRPLHHIGQLGRPVLRLMAAAESLADLVEAVGDLGARGVDLECMLQLRDGFVMAVVGDELLRFPQQPGGRG